jgi:hypothetical protein
MDEYDFEREGVDYQEGVDYEETAEERDGTIDWDYNPEE